ncbi:carbohydrate ABC transporter permease [Microlunatus speluncae]|uniref:carbohydrate ABC transporter permease n=1 Tax=Microlunatus speluncae TaxID=2594267 RepID=UPI0012665959|nr:carbohydrate ABC transporter permease [Microlunatus speluncae]
MATIEAPVTRGTTAGNGQRRRGPGRNSPWFHVGMIPFTLIYISPLIFVVAVSLRPFDDITRRGIAALPGVLSFEGFSTAFSAGVRHALLNSALVTVVTVLFTLLLASMGAFALSRFRIPFRRTILLTMLAGNLLPPQILLIPVAKIAEGLGIYDTLLALIVVQVGFGLGFYTFVLHGFMRGIPREVFEAAVVDGAGAIRTYVQIVLPLCRPALAALGALATTWVFNDLIWAMTVLRTETNFPITAALLNLQGSFISKWNVVAAGSIIAAIPPAIVFFLFQKHFVSGLLVGANK